MVSPSWPPRRPSNPFCVLSQPTLVRRLPVGCQHDRTDPISVRKSKNSTDYIGRNKTKALVQYPAKSAVAVNAKGSKCSPPAHMTERQKEPPPNKKTGGSDTDPPVYISSLFSGRGRYSTASGLRLQARITGPCAVAASQPDPPRGCPATPHPEPESPASPLASSDCPSRTACHRSDGSRRRARHRTMQT